MDIEEGFALISLIDKPVKLAGKLENEGILIREESNSFSVGDSSFSFSEIKSVRGDVITIGESQTLCHSCGEPYKQGYKCNPKRFDPDYFDDDFGDFEDDYYEEYCYDCGSPYCMGECQFGDYDNLLAEEDSLFSPDYPECPNCSNPLCDGCNISLCKFCGIECGGECVETKLKSPNKQKGTWTPSNIKDSM